MYEVIEKIALSSTLVGDKVKVNAEITFESGKRFKTVAYHSHFGSCTYERMSPGDKVKVIFKNGAIRGVKPEICY